MAQPTYIGRFAPSPTGPLHLGSLTGALASYLDAKANNGVWLVRIEDLDPPREIPGSANAILHSLETHGLNWDREILYQSDRHHAYREILDKLTQRKLTFYCSCSRRELREAGNTIYPGTCRKKQLTSSENAALRLRINNQHITIEDLFQGPLSWELEDQVGDFIILRRDGLFAYQLAVVVDDIHQGVTHVVRGTDLLDSTPKQAYLYSLLDKNCPQFGHFPVIVDEFNNKLSKQAKAQALNNSDWRRNLLNALAALGQKLPPTLSQESPLHILKWAVEHWSRNLVSKRTYIKQSNLPNL